LALFEAIWHFLMGSLAFFGHLACNRVYEK